MNGRNANKKSVQKKGEPIEGQFFAFPHVVLKSKAYIGLSSSAKAFLLELGLQVGPGNNGKLIATAKKLKPRGWNSNGVITRVVRELKAAGLIYQTVQGYRPNRASWYALTWLPLANSERYDIGAMAGFSRNIYLTKEGLSPKPSKHDGPYVHPLMRPATDHKENVVLILDSGAANDLIAPDMNEAA